MSVSARQAGVRGALAAGAVMLGQGCAGDSVGAAPPVASVEVTPAADTLIALGQSRQLSALAKDGDGNIIRGVTFAWTSSNELVATVSPHGLVTALRGGQARIAAIAAPVAGNALVVVQPVARLAFDPPPGTVEAQTTFASPIRVAIQDADGTVVTRASHDVTVGLAANPQRAILSGTTTVRAVAGIATFTDLRVDRPGSGFVLEAQAAGLPLHPSAPFSVRVTFAQVTAGSGHSCGVTAAGVAYCWGANVDGTFGGGQLGDGSTTNRLTPAPVAGGLRFVQLSAGVTHTCGVTIAGDAYCWGANAVGWLGDGTTTQRLTPTPVSGGLRFAQVSAGIFHTCGVTASSVAYCWGYNGHGQLGDGTTSHRATPTPVTGGRSFAQVSAGNAQTCGVTTEHVAYCWGGNGDGQLGDGTIDQRLSPTPVVGGLSFTQVSVAVVHTCGVTTDQFAYCWGRNAFGELGDGTTTPRATPTRVGTLSFVRVRAGARFTCGVTPANAAYCWGSNEDGRLGDGTTEQRVTPAAVAGGLSFASVGGLEAHTCGVTLDHVVYCWGANAVGQVGDGTTDPRPTPVRVVQ